MKTMFRKLAIVFSLLVTGGAALVWHLNVQNESDIQVLGDNAAPDQSLVARGAYLARAGNCQTCHTAVGGQSFAGGRGIDTPFGTVYTSNLTPDAKTGLGNWSSGNFWRAMHNGRSQSGRLLYPAFPYTEYTKVTRADSDALYAYLRSLPAVEQVSQANTLRFPYNTQAALAVWRALYFKPGTFEAVSTRDAEWNRGAYLVTGLGHCGACHTARNSLGATRDSLNLAGGLIPMQNWYAPSLTSPHEAGVGTWSTAEIVKLLKTGVSEQASVNGPMTDVVLNSTQYLSDADLGAMAHYLKELPQAQSLSASASAAPTAVIASAAPLTPAAAERGAKLYEQHCVQCHGAGGKGIPDAYPALAGNRAVTMPSTVNLVQVVLNGGFAPATEGNPRPFGMPPFVLVLNDTDIASVLTHIRNAWGNQGSQVTPLEVNRIRAGGGS